MAIPKVFISYSHDDQSHKKWVLDLATRLRNFGVDAILDQFRLGLGSDLAGFMEKELEQADRVIMVCTEKYVEKANAGKGGVGYEKMILTAEYMNKVDSTKVIPLIRQQGSRDVPTFLKTKLHIDFSKEDDFELMFDELVREIHGEPLFKEPPVGINPFQTIEDKPAERNNDAKLLVLKMAIQFYELGHDIVKHIEYYKRLEMSRILFEIYALELIEDGFLVKHSYQNGHIRVTDKAKLYALQQGWITE
ncbi:TPA: toll/interleukin-1 receptor domain-containing protein [Vibrio vulnificus]